MPLHAIVQLTKHSMKPMPSRKPGVSVWVSMLDKEPLARFIFKYRTKGML
jgi:hypothetical protein